MSFRDIIDRRNHGATGSRIGGSLDKLGSRWGVVSEWPNCASLPPWLSRAAFRQRLASIIVDVHPRSPGG